MSPGSSRIRKYDENYKLFVRSQRKLLRARDGAGAFTHGQTHMVVAQSLVLAGREDTKVLDILD